jgi:hypothetical protein
MPNFDAVKQHLTEIQKLGATVTRGKRSTEAEVLAAEKSVGFSFPAEYRAFLLEIGSIVVELERTWFFYGLKDGLTLAKAYSAEFDAFREDGNEDGPYYPKRFVVLMDWGEFGNAAYGWVYDADLDALLHTDGGRYVSRDEAFGGGYLVKLLEELAYVRECLEDESDDVVADARRERGH